jgi:site-specific DNA-methyltransferase (adenine-specific)|tara:strand:+ start:99 stop:863 length:765 start_codon:yes stop_codon:yes gene_type:complete
MSKIDLRLGDCFEVMKTIEDNSVDAIICDLPYGTTQCKWDSVIPFEPLWEQYNRIIKHNGAIVLFSAQPFTSALISSNYKMFKYSWTWDKSRASGFLNAKKQPLRVTEDICVFYKKQCTYNPILIDRDKKNIRNTDYTPNKEGVKTYGKTRKDFKYNEGREIPIDKGYPKNLLHIKTVGTNTKNKRFHPTQKPLELMEYLINTYTNEGETVLDNTMGSGTTMVACKNLNRNGIGIEKDEKYFKIAQERINSTLF